MFVRSERSRRRMMKRIDFGFRWNIAGLYIMAWGFLTITTIALALFICGLTLKIIEGRAHNLDDQIIPSVKGIVLFYGITIVLFMIREIVRRSYEKFKGF